MPNLLHFDWQKDRDGYEFLEFEGSGTEWNDDPENGICRPSPPQGASQSTVRLLQKWGCDIRSKLDDTEHEYFLEPIGDQTVSCRPLDENPGLFMEFVECSTNETIRDFANKYGQLGTSEQPWASWSWLAKIYEMRGFVRSWERAKKAGSVRKWSARLNHRNYESRGPVGGINLNVRLADTDDPLRPAFHLVPDDLLAAMWLQLAQQAAASTGLRRCLRCSTWFVYGTGTGRRSSGHYCSPRCQKAHWVDMKKLKSMGKREGDHP